MTKPWEEYKDVILRLYKQENRPLHEVQRIAEKQYGFKASARAFRSRFDKWGVHKYNCRNRDRRHSMATTATTSCSDETMVDSAASSPTLDGDSALEPTGMLPIPVSSDFSAGRARNPLTPFTKPHEVMQSTSPSHTGGQFLEVAAISPSASPSPLGSPLVSPLISEHEYSPAVYPMSKVDQDMPGYEQANSSSRLCQDFIGPLAYSFEMESQATSFPDHISESMFHTPHRSVGLRQAPESHGQTPFHPWQMNRTLHNAHRRTDGVLSVEVSHDETRPPRIQFGTTASL